MASKIALFKGKNWGDREYEADYMHTALKVSFWMKIFKKPVKKSWTPLLDNMDFEYGSLQWLVFLILWALKFVNLHDIIYKS